MNTLLYTTVFFVFPLMIFTSWIWYGFGTIFSIQTQESPWGSLGKERLLSHLKYRAPLWTGRRCGGSPIPATMTLPLLTGKIYKTIHWASPLSSFIMLSILSIPIAEIPFHFSTFPLPRGKPSSPMSSPTPNSLLFLGNPPSSETILLSLSSLASTNVTSLPPSCLPTLLSHFFLPTSVRPLMPPCLLPAPSSLSCWWTGGSTELWRTSLEPSSLCFSTLYFSLSEEQWLAYYPKLLEGQVAAPEGGTQMNGSPCIPSPSQTPKPHSAWPMCNSFPTNSLTCYSSN